MSERIDEILVGSPPLLSIGAWRALLRHDAQPYQFVEQEAVAGRQGAFAFMNAKLSQQGAL